MTDIDQVESMKDFLRTALAAHPDSNISAQALVGLAVEMRRDGLIEMVREAQENL